MEMTNPDYFDFWPDTGHLAAGGSKPLEVYKTYRPRSLAHTSRIMIQTSNGRRLTGDAGRAGLFP